MHDISLMLFSNDLRLRDNRTLYEAAHGCRHLLCLYCIDPALFRPGRYTLNPMGDHRWTYLRQSLNNLATTLGEYQQKLIVRYQSPEKTIGQLLQSHNITAVYRSKTSDFQNNHFWHTLVTSYPDITFEEVSNNTLLHPDELPFAISDLPTTFSQFRKQVQHQKIAAPTPHPRTLPPPAPKLEDQPDTLPATATASDLFCGGESAGIAHLTAYFSSLAPSHYKETRNALQGAMNSTHFSPYLAHGCLSARQVIYALHQYEAEIARNASTEWILFELLWRDYFQWYALKNDSRLFHSGGPGRTRKNTCFYAERFQKWCTGHTPWPIVNACMKELKTTGFLSNRGRQIVASCLIHEMAMDWRYGAAWFEHQLIDYDVASNWGNWQYLAGVGADPRGSRHFNLEKQTRMYDPDHRYIKHWQGEKTYPLDSTDISDWPIMPIDSSPWGVMQFSR